MTNLKNLESNTLQINGKGLFSKDEVFVSIHKIENSSDIVFLINNERIRANVKNVTNTARNTVLGKGNASICLIEHFLSACSVLGIEGIEVQSNASELVFDDGSAMHWLKLFKDYKLARSPVKKYELKEPIFIKDGEKTIAAIPSENFKVSYFMDYDHPAIGKKFVTWERGDNVEQLLRARTFAKKEENDFFGVSGRILSLRENDFDMELHEIDEPAYHKTLDIIGDLRLCGENPVEIDMYVISYKGGHSLNVELAKKLKEHFNF